MSHFKSVNSNDAIHSSMGTSPPVGRLDLPPMPEGWSSTPLPGPDVGECLVVTSSRRCSAIGFSRSPSRSVFVCGVHWDDDEQMIEHYRKSLKAKDLEAAGCFADRHNELIGMPSEGQTRTEGPPHLSTVESAKWTGGDSISKSDALQPSRSDEMGKRSKTRPSTDAVGPSRSNYLTCSYCPSARGLSRISDDSVAVCSRDWRSTKALEALRERYLGLGNLEASNILAARLKFQIDSQKSHNATYVDELKRNPARKAARQLKKRLWEKQNYAKKATSKQAAVESAAGEGSDHPSSDSGPSMSSANSTSD